MKKHTYILMLIAVLIFANCGVDNYEEPTSMLTGRITYGDYPIGLEHGKIKMKLFQDGYDLYQEIPVYVSYDGTFSAILYNGKYRLVGMDDGCPWVNDQYAMELDIQGDMEIEYVVIPYFTLNNVIFSLSDNSLIGRCTIEQIVKDKRAEQLNLYIGKSHFLDNNSYNHLVQMNINSPRIGENIIIQNISNVLENNEILYARFGLKIEGISEMIYSSIMRIK